jgi:hypothetical protein
VEAILPLMLARSFHTTHAHLHCIKHLQILCSHGNTAGRTQKSDRCLYTYTNFYPQHTYRCSGVMDTVPPDSELGQILVNFLEYAGSLPQGDSYTHVHINDLYTHT